MLRRTGQRASDLCWHATYTDRFYELARLVPYLVTPKNKRIKRYIYGLALQIRGMVAAMEPTTIQKADLHTRSREVAVGMAWEGFKTLMREELCPSNEMQKLKTELWNHDMVGVGHVAYIEKFQELARSENGGLNPEKRRNKEEPSKDRNGRDDNKRTRTGNAFAITINPVRRRTGVVPRNMNPVNAKNPAASYGACFECGGTWEGIYVGAEEARQDSNIMTAMFTLNNHYATTLFDSVADYNFVSTTFIPLLGLEPSDLGFSYEIKIASEQLVEINKVIKGYKLEIEGHMFDINLILFGSGSFDVIIQIDWLSNHKVEIISHEKVVRIPLPNDKVLRVIGERPEEKMRHLIIPGAITVVKSPYRLAPFEMEELSGQLKELQDKGLIRPKLIALGSTYGIHVDPSKIEAVKNWEAPKTPFEVRSFLGLPRYYHRFIKNFSKIAKSLTVLTQKSKTFDWGEEQDRAFQSLKDKLCNAYVLALPYGAEDLVVYCDASGLGLGCVLMQIATMTVKFVTILSSIKSKILAAQEEESDESTGLQRGLDEMIEHRSDCGMKKDIVVYVSRCLTCLKVNAEHQRSSVLLQQLKILEWKWERIAMDFVTKLPRTSSRHDTIWVIMDRLTKYGVLISIISDRDSRFTSRFWQSMQKIKDRLKAAHDRQKCYADKRRKPLEFSVGDYVLLKVSPLKGVARFGKKRKLAPRFVGPFEITERIGPVSYRLRLPEKLNGVHDTFHVSNLKKCLADPTLQVPLDEIQVDDKLNFMEEPVEILEREFKKLKRSRIAIVKVRWNSKRGPKFT
ncbi:putative reverse transcriptase domain-containing protein [Tanacetum coccineum]